MTTWTSADVGRKPRQVIAGEAVADLYDHQTHGGDMDFGTVGSQYWTAAFGLLLAFGMWVFAYVWSGQLTDHREWKQMRESATAS